MYLKHILISFFVTATAFAADIPSVYFCENTLPYGNQYGGEVKIELQNGTYIVSGTYLRYKIDNVIFPAVGLTPRERLIYDYSKSNSRVEIPARDCRVNSWTGANGGEIKCISKNAKMYVAAKLRGSLDETDYLEYRLKSADVRFGRNPQDVTRYIVKQQFKVLDPSNRETTIDFGFFGPYDTTEMLGGPGFSRTSGCWFKDQYERTYTICQDGSPARRCTQN